VNLPFIIAQILGIVVIAIFAVAPHLKAKPEMMLCIVIGNVLTVVEFTLLGASTEVAVIAISLVRSIAFFFVQQAGKEGPRLAPGPVYGRPGGRGVPHLEGLVLPADAV